MTSSTNKDWLISLHGQQVPVVYPEDPNAQEPTFKPFCLPEFPLSQFIWLTGLTEYFQTHRHRGLAVLLLVDTSTGCWRSPALPSQRCSCDGASFRLDSSQLARLPSHLRVAGSLLLATVNSPEEAAASVPGFDGLHLVFGMGQPSAKYSFLRVRQGLYPRNAPSVIYDDWKRYFEQCADRLVLE